MAKIRGTGMVYRRGQTWWISWYTDGLRQYESSKSTVKQVAVDLLKTKLAHTGPTVTRQIKVDELLDNLDAYYRVQNPKSYEDFCKPGVKNLRDFFAGRKASKITTATINDYKRERKEAGKANGTINRELALLRRAYHLAFESTPKKVAEIPKFIFFPEAKPRQGFLEPEQFNEFLGHVPERYRGLVTVAYYTGARKGELMGLKKSQVDLSARMIRLNVGETKNDDGRYLPIYGQMLPEVERLMCYPGNWLFSDTDGTVLPDIQGIWKTLRKRAGLPNLLFHDFRRCGVRNMIRAGIPEQLAMKISGHRSTGVFRRYNIINEKDIVGAAAKLEQYFASRPLNSDKNGYKIQTPMSEPNMLSWMGLENQQDGTCGQEDLNLHSLSATRS